MVNLVRETRNGQNGVALYYAARAGWLSTDRPRVRRRWSARRFWDGLGGALLSGGMVLAIVFACLAVWGLWR